MCKSGSSGSARPVSVAGIEAGPGRGNFKSLTDWLAIRLRIITRMSVLLTRRYWVNAVSCCLSHSASVLSVDPFLHNASRSLVPRFRLTFAGVSAFVQVTDITGITLNYFTSLGRSGQGRRIGYYRPKWSNSAAVLDWLGGFCAGTAAPCQFTVLVLGPLEKWAVARVSGRADSRVFAAGLDRGHTPNIAFRHLPPNSARFSYATEGALSVISAQLSSDAVSALRKVRVLIWL